MTQQNVCHYTDDPEDGSVSDPSGDADIRPFRYHRRAVLHGMAGAALGFALHTDDALAQTPPATPEAGAHFTETTVRDLARAMASQPYVAPRVDDLPDALKNLTRDQYAGIQSAPGAAIWSDAGLEFTLEPLHRGFAYTDRVALYAVEDGVIRSVPYTRDRFDGGGVVLPDPGQQDLGYSGLRIKTRFGGQELLDFAIFQGVSFFKLVARGQGFGVNGRALMVRPADSRGEDYPRWRAFFVERPAQGSAEIVLHALLDAESCSGAFRMVLRPGDPSVAEVEGRLFTRSAIDHLGLGGMQASYLFGPHDPRGADDARVAAYASGGLQIRNGSDEAIWRPVRNTQALEVSSFLDANPKGFGLMQRARDYMSFQDDVQHWEWRPSLWIEPQGAEGVEGIWRDGAVTLIEIPSDSEVNENILVYWRPKIAIPAKIEATFRYRQTWCWLPPGPAPLAICSNTRSGRGSGGTRRLFLVDFSGEALFSGPGDVAPELRTVLTAKPGTIARQILYFYPERRTVRVAFELDPGSERLSELRLFLKAGERQVSETWLYRWAS